MLRTFFLIGRRTYSQRGFSMVELMVAMTLSLILMAGVLSIFFSSKVTYFSNQKTARLQENGRIALDLLVHDIRSAGYPGCSKQTPNSTLNNPTSLMWNYSQPLAGFEASGTGTYSPALTGLTLTPTPVNDSDVILVRMLLRDGVALTMQSDLAAPTDAIVVPGTNPVTTDQIMMITDCNASSIFQVRSWTAGSPNGQIGHANTTGTGPGNASQDLGYLYRAGARVLPLQTVIYWVGLDSTNGNEPTLYRQMGNATPEALVAGVQALQIAYGEDTNADRVVDNYFAASGVSNWDNIISVSVSVLVRSDASGSERDRRTYPLLTPAATALGGKTLGPFNDNRQRMIFTTTAAVRNRAL